MSTLASLAFQAFGPNNAPTIVFLRGGGVGGWMWQPVIKHLPEYHCLAPDQPEHGGSRQIGPFSMELAANKVTELIRDQVQGGKACAVGLSEGAQIAVQLLAPQVPQRRRTRDPHMPTKPAIRPATTADAQAAASLIGMAMGRLAHILFEPRTPTSVIAELFPHRGNRFSHQFVDLAETDGSVVGLVLSYPGRMLNRLGLSTGYRLLRLYGAIPFARFARRALPLSHAREANADEYFVSALAVSPAFQGQGAGGELMLHAEAKARSFNLARCALTVDVGNVPARRLYERLGYRTVDTMSIAQRGRSGGPESLYRMVKVI